MALVATLAFLHPCQQAAGDPMVLVVGSDAIQAASPGSRRSTPNTSTSTMCGAA
ncbi:MAG: hypothetical protein ACR2NR_09730 [Solirubrobacteraceae bacterium]